MVERDGGLGGYPKALRRGVAMFGASALLLGGLLALQQIPGALPAAADAMRWLVGDQAVTRLEDGVYSWADQVKRRVYRQRAPRTHWAVDVPPPLAPSASAANANDTPEQEPPVPRFRPDDVGPMFPSRAAEGDGMWLPAEPGARAENAVSFKTLIHPDAERSYAELFVVALDLERVSLHAVAGSAEPENSAPGAHEHVRTALVPDQHKRSLLAAFNGGFKSTHGHFGMRVDGVTLAPPKPHSCTIAMFQGELSIATFSKLEGVERSTWFRQTPRCMVEEGVRHPRLANSRSWGATLDGKTVIRRSAIGLDRSGRVLFVAISNSTTADVLARGMQHAGADTVAQLDVNYSFPRFLFYERTADGLTSVPLAEGFVFSKGQYVTSRSARDFFYVTRFDQIETNETVEVPRG